MMMMCRWDKVEMARFKGDGAAEAVVEVAVEAGTAAVETATRKGLGVAMAEVLWFRG